MKVMGYFCIGANTRWGLENPQYSYGTPSAYHIPFTDKYLNYLQRAIKEALIISNMNGFMIDWVWNPADTLRAHGWIESEKALFEKLMGKPFPGEDRLLPKEKLEYERKSIERCWETIQKAAKDVKPDCIIWLSCNNLENPTVVNSKLFKEVDWLMNENVNPSSLEKIQNMVGRQTQLIQCLVGWGEEHDARGVLDQHKYRELNVYGFAKPNENSLPLPIDEYLSHPYEYFKGNDRNIAILARYFNQLNFESIHKN
jgi:hypothetical protein